MKEKRLTKEFTKGLLRENPVLRLVLGLCPALAISVELTAALGMGLATASVLLCSNVIISALRRAIPNKVRIPAYITLIAGLVGLVQLLVKAWAPQIDQALGIYLPLIAVNCIILGRADGFANRNGMFASALDGLGMGAGFTGALVLLAFVREFFGGGSIAGVQLLNNPAAILILPPGGFFVFACLIALANHLQGRSAEKAHGCGACSAKCEGGCVS